MKSVLIIAIVFVIVLISIIITHFITKRVDEKWIFEFQRHDYHNHMQTLKAYLSMNQLTEMSEYLDHLEEDLDSIDIAIKTGNTSVNAILSSKVSIAQRNNINVNCKASVPPSLKISDVHLCTIIGNLLDNAIESCQKLEVDKRFIRIYIGLFKEQLYISVTNSTNQTHRKKLTELITSKKGEHGFGLRRIDKIVDQYDGYLNRKNEPGVFATEIMLPL